MSDSITIEMDAPTQAFYKGVAAGRDANERVREEKDWRVKIRNYFFFAGRASAEIPEEHLELFGQGVATGIPSEPQYVIAHDRRQGLFWSEDATDWISPPADLEDALAEFPTTVDWGKRADYPMPQFGVWVSYDPAKHG